MGWRNNKKIKKRWSNSGRRLGGPLSASVTRRMRDPECCRDCKHRRDRGTAVIQRKYRSSEVNKSIAKAIIDRNAPRWFTTKLMFSQKPKLIRSVARDGLTNIYKLQGSLNIYKNDKNNRDLNSAKMHFRSKFGDSSLNGWWVMVWTSSKWGKIWLSS